MQEKKDKQFKNKTARSKCLKRIAVGALVLALLLAGGISLFRHYKGSPANDEASAIKDTGIIDWQQVIAAHPDYEKLKELQADCKKLELETQNIDDLLTINNPIVADKPFQDAVWQKEAHDIIGGRAELERKAKKLRQEYEKATDGEYQARRKAIDNEYLDAILNIRIRLDNQKSMHNWLDSKQSIAEERDTWNQQLQTLQQERGDRQRQLYNERQQDIARYVQKTLGPEFTALKQSVPQLKAEQEAAAMNKKTAAESRNADAMQKQVEIAQKVQQQIAKRQELAVKKNQLQAMETHILNDIAGKAAKIAIMHHFTLILVDHPTDIADYNIGPKIIDPLQVKSGRAIGINTVDVTDELIQEVKNIATDDAVS